jgi:hypothetical protein
MKDPSPPVRYELRVEGHLDQHWSTWFGGLTISHEADGTTALRGIVTDQSELHGLLAKVRDLGATLISVTPANVTQGGDSQQQQHR